MNSKETDLINRTHFTNSFSQSIWEQNYKLKTEQTIEDTWRRVAKAVASVEKTEEQRKEWEEKFYNLLSDFKLVPGGRILANAGSPVTNTSLINCFVSPKPDKDIDSLEGIMWILQRQAQTLKAEGGWGCNFSFIRPRGSYIKGVGVRTPGAVKYMELFDKASEVMTEGPGAYTLAFDDVHVEEKLKIRKGAMMFVLNIDHPDIEEYITAKRKPNHLTKANLSVNVSNEFMAKLLYIQDLYKTDPEKASKEDLWDLVFPDTSFDKYKSEWDGNINLWKSKGYPIKIYKTVKLTELWNKIMKSTYDFADPGVLFMDTANKDHCANYVKGLYIDSCNPCGEQMLISGGCCNLSSFNITQYIKINQSTHNVEFDFAALNNDIPAAVRFLDNVIEIANVPLPEYKETMERYRRIGLGIMGTGSALAMLNMTYGSASSLVFLRNLLTTFNTTAILASIDLAKERGPFTNCEPEQHFKNIINTFPYIFQENKDLIHKKIQEAGGIRNSALFSIQPTGNTGCLANCVSGGLEPIFETEYVRTVNVPTLPEELDGKVPKYWEGDMTPNEYFKEVNKYGVTYLQYKEPTSEIVYKIFADRGLCKDELIKDYALVWAQQHDITLSSIACAMDLSAEAHISVLKLFAEHLDSSASKTINVAADCDYEDFKNIYIDAYKTKRIKGVTTYRDQTKAGVLNKVSNTEEETTTCATKHLIKTNAPKRPKSLPCNLHLMTIKNIPYYAIVSMYGDDPYEVFIGENKEDITTPEGEYVGSKLIFFQKLNNCAGELIKQAQGKYLFKTKDIEIPISRKNEAEDAALISAFSRILSWGLRHGGDIKYAIEQLDKTEGTFSSATKVFSRVLKKYINNNDKPESKCSAKDVCPKCGSAIVRTEGCKHCPKCGWSACG